MSSLIKYSPVIILGMHRSGTTMVTNLLERLGLFVGDRKEPNNEALFFINLNTWMMREALATWDIPDNFFYTSDFFKKNVRRVITRHLHSLKSIEYLGRWKYMRYRDIRNLDIPWGWKDPRNTFTIDIWHEIFPDAKVIHIFRNPLDVAQSLRKREEAKNTAILEHGLRLKGFKLRKREYLLKRRTGYQEAFRLADIHENVRLWDLYTRKALSLDALLGKNILHVCYETMLDNFIEEFMPVLDFIGFQKSATEVAALAHEIKKDRKYAFTRNNELVDVYNEIKGNDLVKKLGYHNIV